MQLKTTCSTITMPMDYVSNIEQLKAQPTINLNIQIDQNDSS